MFGECNGGKGKDNSEKCLTPFDIQAFHQDSNASIQLTKHILLRDEYVLEQ